MSRYFYMNKLETVNSVNVEIYDPMSIDFSDFPWKNGWQEYRVQEADIKKFYRVSAKFYGTYDYEHILLLLNNISDPWELLPGNVIYIPDLIELKRYLLKKRK